MSDEKHLSSAKFPDANTRFRLNGPTYSEIKAEEARTQTEVRKIFAAIRQREARKATGTVTSNPVGEVPDDRAPDDDVEPGSPIELSPLDHANVDPDDDYFFESEGKVWPWWQLHEDCMLVTSRGHRHEIRADINKHWHQGADPEGFAYCRDDISMGKFFHHLRDAIAFVEAEIQAQFDFEHKIWGKVRAGGMSNDRQHYVIEHAFYLDRIALCEDFLGTP